MCPLKFCSPVNVSCRFLRSSGPSTPVHRIASRGRLSLNITSASSPDPPRPVARDARWLSSASPFKTSSPRRAPFETHFSYARVYFFCLYCLSPSFDLFTLMKSSLPLDCCYLAVFPFDELWREAIQQRGKKTGVLSGWLKLVWPSRQEASCAPLKRLRIKADGRRQSM